MMIVAALWWRMLEPWVMMSLVFTRHLQQATAQQHNEGAEVVPFKPRRQRR